MKRLLLSLGLWFTSALAFASGVPTGSIASASSTDLSMRYLNELFGSISNILPGTGSGLMGQLFYALNEGILVVAGIWLVFTIFNVLLSAGLEGTLHNPQKKTTMVLFRVAIGLALLVPSSTTGYSAIQDLMMKVVVEGVNLADETWNYALTYLGNGGVLYDTPSSNSNYLSTYDALLNKVNYGSSGAGPVQQILDDEMLMNASNAYNQQQVKSGTASPTVKLAAQTPYQMVFVPPTPPTSSTSGTPGEILFPGVGNIPPYSADNNSDNAGEVVAYAQGSNLNTNDYEESYAALKQMALSLQPVAQAEINQVVNGDQPISNSSAGGDIASAATEYMQLIMPYARKQQDNVSSTQTAFIQNAQAEGWIGAGGFYWDLMSLNDAANQTLSLTSYVPSVSPSSTTMPSDVENWVSQGDENLGGMTVPAHSTIASLEAWPQAIIQGSAAASGMGYGSNSTSGVLNAGISSSQADEIQSILNNGGSAEEAVQAVLSNLSSSEQANLIANPDLIYQQPTSVNQDYSTGGVDFGGVIQGALSQVVSTVNTIETSSSNSAFYDPLMFVQQVGQACLTAAGSIWATSVAWILGLSAVSGICTSVSPGGTIMNSIMTWVTPLWQGTAVALFAAGFMLTFYAPLYPYLLFLFGAIGWMIYVLEAMVAAPLVAFGMTHPEGHDFVGRAEQALMLALSVFLRPVLMVIGFLVAMMLSYIGFSMVNFTFGEVLEASAGSAHTGTLGTNLLPAIWTVVNGAPTSGQSDNYTQHDLSDFLLIPLLVICYGLIIIEVVNQCFSLIHVLPDMVLRWIGGPVQQDQSERYAGQVQSGLSGSARQAGQLAGQGASGFGGFVGNEGVSSASSVLAGYAGTKLSKSLGS